MAKTIIHLHDTGYDEANEVCMLLRFGVENYRSFRRSAELSFVSTKLIDSPPWRIPCDLTPAGLLPVVGVYGANASGKSNLLRALQVMMKHVKSSFARLRPDEPIPWSPWRQNQSPGAPNTQFDVDFLVGGVRHHYGFRFNATRFEEEWLYRWPRGHRQVLFHRDHREADPWHFGRELGGARKVIKEATRPNALFLSAAAQFNHEVLGEVAHHLTDGAVQDSQLPPQGTHPLFPQDSVFLDPSLQPVLQKLLCASDVGVQGFTVRNAVESKTALLATMRENLQTEAFASFSQLIDQQGDLKEVWLRHSATDGEPWELPPFQESHGTQVLLTRLSTLLPTLFLGGWIVIDELERALHPDLCAELIALFAHPETNPKGAQLLFSTHDRSLLSRLRRDEVVLVDKDNNGESTLRTASDFRLRGRDDLSRAHQEGRMGGVPVLGDIAAAVRGFYDHGA